MTVVAVAAAASSSRFSLQLPVPKEDDLVAATATVASGRTAISSSSPPLSFSREFFMVSSFGAELTDGVGGGRTGDFFLFAAVAGGFFFVVTGDFFLVSFFFFGAMEAASFLSSSSLELLFDVAFAVLVAALFVALFVRFAGGGDSDDDFFFFFFRWVIAGVADTSVLGFSFILGGGTSLGITALAPPAALLPVSLVDLA